MSNDLRGVVRQGENMNNERQYDYPEGTKAHAYNGGAWLRTARGWQWNGHTRNPGSAFQTPGADAFGYCVELPHNASFRGGPEARPAGNDI